MPVFNRDVKGKFNAQKSLITRFIGSGSKISEDEFNEMQWLQAEAKADILRKTVHSGFISSVYNVTSSADTSIIDGNYNKSISNYFSIGKNDAVKNIANINGYLLSLVNPNVWGSAGNGLGIQLPEPPTADYVDPAGRKGYREDLVFLEAWFEEVDKTDPIYKYGGEASGTVTNDLHDTARFSEETNRAVQLRWRIRTVAGVDFNKYFEGLQYANGTNYPCLAQGGNSDPLSISGDATSAVWYGMSSRNSTSLSGKKIALDDQGLYVAGDGSATSKDLLKTADGYVYAIPLFRVKRRNSGGFYADNPNGASNYYAIDLGTIAPFYPDAILDLVVSESDYNKVTVGDKIANNGNASVVFQVVSKKGANTLSIKNAGIYVSNATANSYNLISTRPDKLYSNIIDERDIIDLRHKVSLTGYNYQQLLEENFDKLLRGELQTRDKKTMLKTYHGIKKTPLDANHVFYASLDGTTTAEVGGALNLGTGSFRPMPTGLGYKFNGDSQTPVAVAGLSANEGTIDCWVDFTNASAQRSLVTLIGADEKAIGIFYYGSTRAIQWTFFDSGGVYTSSGAVTEAFTGRIHFRIRWKSDTFYIYINGVLAVTKSYTVVLNQPTKILIGQNFNGTISDLAISNIDRGANFATLPEDFKQGYARIMPAFSGQRHTYSDALTSHDVNAIAKGAGSGHSYGITATQATPGAWASGDTIKVKGMGEEIISGIIDTDTTLARVTKFISYDAGGPTSVFEVNDTTKLAVNDKIYRVEPDLSIYATRSEGTITAITANQVTVSWNGGNQIVFSTAQEGCYIVETTASSSSPVVKFSNNGVLTDVVGTWGNLGTTEATFTLGTNASLVAQDIQVQYSLNIATGNGGIPEVLTETLAGEINGKKLVVGTVAVRDDFVGKVSGSTTACPNVAYRVANSVLSTPSTAGWVEASDVEISNIRLLDGISYGQGQAISGAISQQLFSFNLVRMVEDKYGTIPALDKVQWLKDNLSKITCNWWGYGSCPAGNKAVIQVWVPGASSWSVSVGTNVTTSSVPVKCYYPANSPSIAIDSNGFAHFLAYTDASDGVTASTIYTDYVNLEIELKAKTGYDMLVPENPRRDDGKACILQVRKETKEVESYFGNVEETDGVVTYGNYLPYQGLIATQGLLLALAQRLLVTTAGTGGAPSVFKALTAKLPKSTSFYDYSFLQDKISLLNDTSVADSVLKWVPVLQPSANGISKRVGDLATDLDPVKGPDIATTVAHISVFSALVIINNELCLKVTLGYSNSKAVQAGGSTGYWASADYKLNGRPLVKA
jgi:hypothetical protein